AWKRATTSGFCFQIKNRCKLLNSLAGWGGKTGFLAKRCRTCVSYWQQPGMPYGYRQSLQLFRQQFQIYYGNQFPDAKLTLETIIPPRAPEGSDYSEWAFFIVKTQ
ncbi:MAG: hypothetical protein PHH58_09160, partial [Rhodoferax sp.]|nr:hypothetical protein [Rhodoferax sp.]